MGSTSQLVLTKDVGFLSIGNGQLCRDAPTQNYCKRTHDFGTLEGVSLPPHLKKTNIQLYRTKQNPAPKCTFERHAIIVQSSVDNIVISSAYLVRYIFLLMGNNS
jgi:hypothetical protein